MKGLLGWVKSNLVIVIALVIAIVAFPAMFFFSLRWNNSIRERVGKDVNSQVSQIDSISVTYEVPAVLPGEQPITVRGAPNEATTRRVTELLEAINTQSEEVRKGGLARNSKNKALLIDGADASNKLFPQPATESDSIRLRSQFNTIWLDAHVKLLRDAHAGQPPSPEQVARSLDQLRNQEIERITKTQEKQTLSEEENEALNQMLSAARLDLYRAAAGAISFYAGEGVFAGVSPWAPGAGVPSLEQCWEWQWMFWIHQDVTAAIEKANLGPSGRWLPVYEAPVKQLEIVSVEPWSPGGSSSVQVGAVDDTGDVPRKFDQSFTGRTSWPFDANPYLDIRYVNLRVIVGSERLQALLNAIAKTNFMTVIDLDVEPIDSLGALQLGYDYGGEHVVRASLRLETIWLRRWMAEYFPPGVRQMLGMPPLEAPKSGEESPQDENQDQG